MPELTVQRSTTLPNTIGQHRREQEHHQPLEEAEERRLDASEGPGQGVHAWALKGGSAGPQRGAQANARRPHRVGGGGAWRSAYAYVDRCQRTGQNPYASKGPEPARAVAGAASGVVHQEMRVAARAIATDPSPWAYNPAGWNRPALQCAAGTPSLRLTGKRWRQHLALASARWTHVEQWASVGARCRRSPAYWP